MNVSLPIQPTGDASEDQRLAQMKAHLEQLASPREAIACINNCRAHVKRNIRNAFAQSLTLMMLEQWAAAYETAMIAGREAA